MAPQAPKVAYRPDSGRPDELYSREFLEHMKGQEMRLHKRFFSKSPQLEFRQVLVSWMVLVVERAKLKRNTLHLAVKLLDFFMDGHNIQQDKLYLVAMASITIAAKFDEKETKVPRLSLLINCTPFELQEDFKQTDSVKNHGHLETLILNYFDWNVFIPTSNSFVEVLTPQVINDVDWFQDHIITPELLVEIRPKFKDHLRYFLRSSILDSSHIEVKPSVMACSVVYAARYCFGLSPPWPPRIRDLVGLDVPDFIDCAFVLIDNYQQAVSGQMGVEGGSGVVGQRRQLPPATKKGRKKVDSCDEVKTEDSDEQNGDDDYVPNKKGKKAAKKKIKTEDSEDQNDDDVVFVGTRSNNRKKGGGGPIRPKRSLTRPTGGKKDKGRKKSSGDEGYGSFADQSSSSEGGRRRISCANNVDMLIRSSEVLEATERRHQSFKQEIKQEILQDQVCSQQ